MKEIIKGYVNSGRLRTIRHVFVDALDVDPTFEKYEEAYEYCKTLQGVMDAHEERTPFRQDPATWDEEYWLRLKVDLAKNFSDVRMCHMREVAQVLLAEKIQRLLAERAAEAERQAQKNTPKPPVEPVTTNVVKPAPSEEEEKRRIDAIRRQIEADNRMIEEQEAATRQAPHGGNWPKKGPGIVVAAGVGVIILVTALVLTLILALR